MKRSRISNAGALVVLIVIVIALGAVVFIVADSRRKDCEARRCQHGVPVILEYHGCVCMEHPR